MSSVRYLPFWFFFRVMSLYEAGEDRPLGNGEAAGLFTRTIKYTRIIKIQ